MVPRRTTRFPVTVGGVSPRALILCFALALGGSADARAQEGSRAGDPGGEPPTPGEVDPAPVPSGPPAEPPGPAGSEAEPVPDELPAEAAEPGEAEPIPDELPPEPPPPPPAEAPEPPPPAPLVVPPRVPPLAPDAARAAWEAQVLSRHPADDQPDPWNEAGWRVVMGPGRALDTREFAALVDARDLQVRLAGEAQGARRARSTLLVLGSALSAGALLQLATTPLAEDDTTREDHLWRAVALGLAGGISFGASPFPIRSAEHRARLPSVHLSDERADAYIDGYNDTLRDWLMLPAEPTPGVAAPSEPVLAPPEPGRDPTAPAPGAP